MNKSNYDPKVTLIKKRNAEVFRETTKIIQSGYYTTPSGKRVYLNMQPMIDGSRCYHKELRPVNTPIVKGGTVVLVEKGDCLTVAEQLVKNGYKPALLNFASAGHPGGGVETGARAQEETICRRSTLTRSIFSFDTQYAAKYGYERQEGNGYPISKSLDFSAIYSPEVTVFRGAGQEYTLLEKPFNVGIITNAALNMDGRFPIKLENGHIPEQGKAITRNKIRTIFRIGLIKGHDSLVLGAFGCGAFHTPPREMAQLFKEVMKEDEFKNRYRLITFAILSDHNDKSGNLAAFESVFGTKQESESKTLYLFTSDNIQHLEENQIFVFGSNLEGLHNGGAAMVAHKLFGAKWGKGVGRTGQCYAIPTMNLSLDIIHLYVDDFIEYAKAHPELEFLVTRIGCGVAGFKPEQIAPLFQEALEQGNIILPHDFVEVLMATFDDGPSDEQLEDDLSDIIKKAWIARGLNNDPIARSAITKQAAAEFISKLTGTITDSPESASDVETKDEEPAPDETAPKAKTKKRTTTLRVTLPDGTVIQEKQAKDTFIKAIKWAGVERVKNLGMILNNLPLIDETQHVLYDGRQEPHLIPGTNLYIITQLNNETKKTRLNQIGKKLGINWKVEVL